MRQPHSHYKIQPRIGRRGFVNKVVVIILRKKLCQAKTSAGKKIKRCMLKPVKRPQLNMHICQINLPDKIGAVGNRYLYIERMPGGAYTNNSSKTLLYKKLSIKSELPGMYRVFKDGHIEIHYL